MTAPPDPPRSAREELREQLLQAARREVAPQAVRRRRPRRGLVIVAALLLGGAAAAGAADLISTGDPVKDRTAPETRYQPAGTPVLAAKARDPDGGLAWGVGVYTSNDGQACAVAGQVRGVEIGELRDGRFHRYERGSTGSCGDLDRYEVVYDRKWFGDVTVVFGRTRYPDRYVVAKSDGESFKAKPGAGGGFVYVFKGRLSYDDVDVSVGAPLKR